MRFSRVVQWVVTRMDTPTPGWTLYVVNATEILFQTIKEV